MSVLRKVLETAARYLPDRNPDPLIHKDGYVGRPIGRVDGLLKVTGGAQFTAEFALDGLAHGALVCSTIAKGHVHLDTTDAEQAPGVVAVISHVNAPTIKRPSLLDVMHPKTFAASDLPILQDDQVHWNGQPVAVVVADTWEQAAHAASLVRVDYRRDTAQL